MPPANFYGYCKQKDRESTSCMCSPFSYLSTTHVDLYVISRRKLTFTQTLHKGGLCKMGGRSVGNANEISADIKTHTLFNRSSTDIYADIYSVYGSYSMSFSTVCRLVSNFSADVGPVISAHKCVRSKSASSPTIVEKILLVKSDARYTSQLIADMVGISKAFALRFWRNSLKLKKESTRWAPHLLNEEKICIHVSTARKLLKRFPRYDQIPFMNVVIGNESWILFFESHRKVRNQLWLIINVRWLCIATRITNAKTVMYAIFFTTKGLAIQVLIPKGRSINASFHKEKSSKKIFNSTKNVNRGQVSVVFICHMTMP